MIIVFYRKDNRLGITPDYIDAFNPCEAMKIFCALENDEVRMYECTREGLERLESDFNGSGTGDGWYVKVVM